MASTLREEKTGVCVLGMGREISEYRKEMAQGKYRQAPTGSKGLTNPKLTQRTFTEEKGWGHMEGSTGPGRLDKGEGYSRRGTE